MPVVNQHMVSVMPSRSGDPLPIWVISEMTWCYMRIERMVPWIQISGIGPLFSVIRIAIARPINHIFHSTNSYFPLNRSTGTQSARLQCMILHLRCFLTFLLWPHGILRDQSIIYLEASPHGPRSGRAARQHLPSLASRLVSSCAYDSLLSRLPHALVLPLPNPSSWVSFMIPSIPLVASILLRFKRPNVFMTRSDMFPLHFQNQLRASDRCAIPTITWEICHDDSSLNQGGSPLPCIAYLDIINSNEQK